MVEGLGLAGMFPVVVWGSRGMSWEFSVQSWRKIPKVRSALMAGIGEYCLLICLQSTVLTRRLWEAINRKVRSLPGIVRLLSYAIFCHREALWGRLLQDDNECKLR